MTAIYKQEKGLCDNCGSDGPLRYHNGQWICDGCYEDLEIDEDEYDDDETEY